MITEPDILCNVFIFYKVRPCLKVLPCLKQLSIKIQNRNTAKDSCVALAVYTMQCFYLLQGPSLFKNYL